MLGIFDRPYADPVRLPLANGPAPILTIMFAYLLFVLGLGPRLMANRKPYQLRAALKVYNVIQILYNSVLFVISMEFILVYQAHNFSCLTVLPPEHEMKNMERVLVYAYYLNKILDLMDTIFFVVRKSYKQITMLHLIHHVYMPTAGYTLIRFFGYGGHVIVVGLLNVIVHIVMYTYYYLSAESPAVRQNLWWKQYITIMQMVQFVLMFLHSIWTLMQPNCNADRPVIYLVLAASSLMLVMFANFYAHAYILPKRKKLTEEKLK
ncbi:very long chain fatty acid elongase F [Drosophila virilis]|uniref:Elongation of very long chain fatty acids protein n=1 Tax=Drosophila virilis TaxID=7244 RepID=B4M4Z2_DROVI|nr:elongation of very long chain fatty acids protein F [Drosophila virilis]EDW59703.1 uncharacterized protein Dvir_GJ11026 [Drosophila virilis]